MRANNRATAGGGGRAWHNIKKDRRLLMIPVLCFAAFYAHQQLALQRRAGVVTNSLRLASIHVPKSHQYLAEKNINECYFVYFYDANQFAFNLQEASYVEIGGWRDFHKRRTGREDTEDTEHVESTIKRIERKRKKLRRNVPKLPPIQRNLTFVHIGKAGGSTIGCNLGAARGYIDHHCDNVDDEEFKQKVPDSAISRSVNCYTHWGMNLRCYYVRKEDKNHAFLINLRSPIKRIASWFTYEHTENHEMVYPDRDHHCGQVVLNSCYQHFEHLTTVGLSYPRPPLSQPLKVGTNLSPLECSYWAWAAVQGNMPADYHNAYNYDWYAHRFLYDPRANKSDIYALRVEHLEQDWSTLDRMLGGDGSFPSTMSSPQNSKEIKQLRIPNHNTTDVGTLNLCRALCDEIQVYKRLLLRSINLKAEDVLESFNELRETCPEETDFYPRECHYDSIAA